MSAKRRQRWVWLIPVAIIVSLVIPIASVFVRHRGQVRAATQIASLGGGVRVRWDGWRWLLHLASDEARARIEGAGSTSTWGSARVRRHLGAAGFDAFIDAWHVADHVELRIENPDKDRDWSSKPEDLPAIVAELERLPTLRKLGIRCEVDCPVKLSPRLASVRILTFECRSATRLPLDLQSLPSGLEELNLAISEPLESAPDLGPLTTLRGLKRLQLFGIPVSESGANDLRNCVALRELAVLHGKLHDSTLFVIRDLPNLELLASGVDEITPGGLRSLKEFPKLTKASFWYERRLGADVLAVEAVAKEVPQLEFTESIGRRRFPLIEDYSFQLGSNGFLPTEFEPGMGMVGR